LVNITLGVHHLALPAGQPFGRTVCVLHAANRPNELRGCLAPGLSFGPWGADLVVRDSRSAMSQLRAALAEPGDHYLHIRPSGGTTEE
jgi:hypothetical protein